MELPKSTPDVAIQNVFGLNDLHHEILTEKVILAVETYQLDDNRIGKQLLTAMMEKEIKGSEACQQLKLESFAELCEINTVNTT